MLLSGPSWVLLSGPSWVRFKEKAKSLDQILTLKCFYAHFWFQKNVLKHLFYSAFGNQCLIENKLEPDINFQKNKLGPENNSTAYIYIYIHTCGHGLVFCLPFMQLFALNSGKKGVSKFGHAFFVPFSPLFLRMDKRCCFFFSKRQRCRQKRRPPP